MSKIQFRNAAHRDFVLENLDKCKVNDCYHRAFFYVMGISEETRMNIGKMFDFKRDCIIPGGMHGGWQTSGTVKVCHLAFNLWNGFTEEGRENLYTPEELFCCGYAPYFMEGIKLRYPEYCRDLTPPKRNDMERKEKMSRKIYIIIAMVFTVVLSVSTFFIIRNHIDSAKQNEVYDNLAEIVQDEPPKENEGVTFSEDKDYLAEYLELYRQNEDMVGWIKVEDTNINYPVVQSVNEPNFYLKHKFDKTYSAYGCPYVQENCDVQKPSDNIIIYGHHMNDGSMFTGLMKYRNKSFWEGHKTITFDTLTDRHQYEVIAVFKTVVYTDSSDSFKYYEFTDAENAAEFDAYVAKCKELSLYDTGVSAEYGDKLISLSTCEYSRNNGRLVVVAKRVD